MSINNEKTGPVEVTECSVCYLQVDYYANLKIHWMKHLSPSDKESEEDEEITKETKDFECDSVKGKPPNIILKK
jgi:hypothetical protein